jgi:hypothetical protein
VLSSAHSDSPLGTSFFAKAPADESDSTARPRVRRTTSRLRITRMRFGVRGHVRAFKSGDVSPQSKAAFAAATPYNIRLPRRSLLRRRLSIRGLKLSPLFEQETGDMAKFFGVSGNQRQIENERVTGNQQIVRTDWRSRCFQFKTQCTGAASSVRIE